MNETPVIDARCRWCADAPWYCDGAPMHTPRNNLYAQLFKRLWDEMAVYGFADHERGLYSAIFNKVLAEDEVPA